MVALITMPVYAAHRDGSRWSIIGPCDDPCWPAWRVIAVIDEPASDAAVWAAQRLDELVAEHRRSRRGGRA
jgi:hypothetical protein